ncbi:acetyltransferase domain-containing protein, putative [Eimeria tenella]|uniref:Acetyltransferase domain-containing protein, putative n=1 Tax=Eimeria tenella TaxID=5802 RepID=U6L417_EIMTE|nr:acetyltransferase domain-containing protein, putative [Eimeria tenella]CDJ42495.1 acetyltransferase domain-containing protein, putative [Eimeria tenella]|eukprot:XP_013233245.1 acetyltransferase domain-containing protein, putative [Eimeria tenella]
MSANSTSGFVSCRWLKGLSACESPVVFTVKDKKYILRKMRRTDYEAARDLLPLVSRCQQQLTEADLSIILEQPTYLPFCCFAAAPDMGATHTAAASPEVSCTGSNGCAEAARANAGNTDSASSEGPLCGFCEVYIQPHLGRAADGRLERVVIHPSFRGQGLGTQMCRLVLQIAQKQLSLGRIDLTVEKDDARHIYTKLGFEPVPTETLRLSF